MMGVMYMVLIRPQQKKQRDQASFTSGIEGGDKVVTSSGLYGTVNHIDDETVHLEVDRDIVVRVARAAVLRSQDTPVAPAKGGGLLGGLMGGGARPTDDPTTSDADGAGRGQGKGKAKGKGGDDANGGDKGQRSKR